MEALALSGWGDGLLNLHTFADFLGLIWFQDFYLFHSSVWPELLSLTEFVVYEVLSPNTGQLHSWETTTLILV